MEKEQEKNGHDTLMEAYEARRRKIQGFNMTGDIFFGKVLEDREACQEVIRIFLNNPDIIVKDVKSQYSIRSLENHSVVLDILAEDRDGKLINIEMQSGGGDYQKRVRYYLASIDMSCLEKGIPYSKLPDVYLIFITEKDIFKRNSGIYHIDRVLREDKSVADNGVHEVYANLSCSCSDERINELLGYIKNSASSYETDVFPNVVKKVRYFKEIKEGMDVMCKLMEEEWLAGMEQGMERGVEQGIEALISDNLEEGKTQALILEKLERHFSLNEEKAREYFDRYAGKNVC